LNSDFPRIITLLRQESKRTQKKTAQDLGISQALLSHYERGIRECGLDFLTRTADYYGVSCDYLLGRTPDRTGAQIAADDIPDADAVLRDNRLRGSAVPTLNKKLIVNSLGLLYDLLQRADCRSLTSEVSSFLMLAVYKVFRLVYSAGRGNTQKFFSVSEGMSRGASSAAMELAESRIACIASGRPEKGSAAVENPESLSISEESMAADYPMLRQSLLGLIKMAEDKMDWDDK